MKFKIMIIEFYMKASIIKTVLFQSYYFQVFIKNIHSLLFKRQIYLFHLGTKLFSTSRHIKYYKTDLIS